jgi:hypothetical protein
MRAVRERLAVHAAGLGRGLAAPPVEPPASGKLALNVRRRACLLWFKVMRPNGRDVSLQPAPWAGAPSELAAVIGRHDHLRGHVEFHARHGLNAGFLGGLASDQHAPLAADLGCDSGLSDRPAERPPHPLARQRRRSGRPDLLRRISLATLQATGIAFFGVFGSKGALAPHPDSERRGELHRRRPPARHTHPLAARHQRRERVADARLHGVSFAIAAGGVLTLIIAAAPNASSVWVRARIS